jgi:NAD(P)-dependent dehydrogenase (short-subunit alcohol dehydrogenase family)
VPSGFAVAHERTARDRQAPVALVTGAARNIGAATAARLQEDGFQIVATVFAEVELEGPGAPYSMALDEARALGAERDWDVLACDLADAAACAELLRFVRDRHGRLDALVCNAATWTYGPALETRDEAWRHVLEVNVVAIVRIVREAHDLLRAAPSPRIVNVSSIGASWAGNGVAPYNVAKAGVSALTRALAIELVDDGILVNAIAPGVIDTTSNALELAAGVTRARRLALVPVGRPGTPEEVAHLVSFLASPRLGFITGEVVTIDGGQLAGAAKELK